MLPLSISHSANDKSLHDTDGDRFEQSVCVHALRFGFPLSAAQRVDRGPELAAYDVVDEEVAGGVDVAEQLRDTGHEGERVEVAAAQTNVRDDDDHGSEDHRRDSAPDEQKRAANQHPCQSYVTHCHGGRRRLFSPRRHLLEFDDSDDGGDADNEEKDSWEHDAVDVTIQRINRFLVVAIKLAGVQFEGCGIGSGIENAIETPSCRDDKACPNDGEEREEEDHKRGLCLKDGLRAERTKHTEASLAGDHHRHETRGRVEGIKSYQVIS